MRAREYLQRENTQSDQFVYHQRRAASFSVLLLRSGGTASSVSYEVLWLCRQKTSVRESASEKPSIGEFQQNAPQTYPVHVAHSLLMQLPCSGRVHKYDRDTINAISKTKLWGGGFALIKLYALSIHESNT